MASRSFGWIARVCGLALLLAPLAACAGGTASDDEAPVDEGALERADTPARRGEKLAKLLKRAGTIQMPPTGRQDQAEQLEVKVTRGPFDGNLDAFAQSEARRVAVDRYDLPEATFERVRVTENVRFEENDTKFESGVSGQSVEDYLINELTTPSKRAEMGELVRSLPGKYHRLLISNRAAELIADEWILIVPASRSAKPIVVHMQYFDE